MLKDRGPAKTMQMMANDRLVHFMAQLPLKSKAHTSTAYKRTKLLVTLRQQCNA
jgi:hypothetical protein